MLASLRQRPLARRTLWGLLLLMAWAVSMPVWAALAQAEQSKQAGRFDYAVCSSSASAAQGSGAVAPIDFDTELAHSHHCDWCTFSVLSAFDLGDKLAPQLAPIGVWVHPVVWAATGAYWFLPLHDAPPRGPPLF